MSFQLQSWGLNIFGPKQQYQIEKRRLPLAKNCVKGVMETLWLSMRHPYNEYFKTLVGWFV